MCFTIKIAFLKRLSVLITSLLIFWNTSYSQKLDLVVINNNDSIACKIKNVSDSLITFKVMFNYWDWIRIKYEKSLIADFKFKYYSRNDLYFNHRKSLMTDLGLFIPANTSLYEVERNSVYMEMLYFGISLVFHSANYR